MLGEPLLVMLSSASGVSVGAGVLAAVAALAGVLPLRGGGGQHAHAGPGTLTVWQLFAQGEPHRQGRGEDRVLFPAALEPGSDPEEVVWPEPGDSESFWPQPVWPEWLAQAPRLLEVGELRDESVPGGDGVEQEEYVGRHRLISPLEKLRADLVFPAC